MNPMPPRSFRGLLWTLAILGLLLDQGTKYGVFRWLHGDAAQHGRDCGEYSVIPEVFSLLAQFDRPDVSNHPLNALRTWGGDMLPRVNHGALFGLGGEYVGLANAVFAGVSIAAALAIAYWSSRPNTVRDPSLCAALGLILAGTVGNLYDRVVFNGVRDFLYWHYKDVFSWPVFNVADCCLVLGAFLLLAQAFWSHSAAKAPQVSCPTRATLTPAPQVAEAK
jgi:lipoprotein signal peptidase